MTKLKQIFCFATLAIMVIFSAKVSAQIGPFPTYYENSVYQYTSPGAMKYGLYGYDNPAVLANVESFDFQFSWQEDHQELGMMDNWATFVALPNTGFGMVKHQIGDLALIDMNYSMGFGNEEFSIGASYGWSAGDDFLFGRANRHFTIGTLMRPSRYLSIGLTGRSYSMLEMGETTAEVGVRPLGDERLALFGDVSLRELNDERHYQWSAGAAFEFLPGVRATGRYVDDGFISGGLQFSFGRAGVGSQAHYDSEGDYHYNTYSFRLGAYDRNVFDEYGLEESDYMNLDLEGRMQHQRFRFFGEGNSLRETLEAIEAAGRDKSVAGIVVNISGMRAGKGMYWEVRNELEKFQEKGKKVVIYFDRVGMEGYYLASVADHVVMDPQGTIVMPGYLMGGTYYKEALDSIGVGIDELRINEYKSGGESFTRNEMSDADREQKERIISDFYQSMRSDVVNARGITPEAFDTIVDKQFMLMPHEAQEAGLVDTTGFWQDSGDWIEALEGERRNTTSAGQLAEFNQPGDNFWGKKPEISVIYAEGIVAKNSGMKTQQIAERINKASADPNVEAIVLRVNSPGGDPVAADLIGNAVRKATEQKPVIVSQGNLAASGGYWISMDADTILAAPGTITGSIGVMSLWMYDQGLKDRLHFNTDFVKEGESADLGFAYHIPIPLLNLALPVRPLSDHERERRIATMEHLYDGFVEKVADGRDMEVDSIRQLAEGRIWTGNDAADLGLIDGLGSLNNALDIAKERAGLEPGDEYEIKEYPERDFADFSRFLPPMFGLFDNESKMNFDIEKEYWEMLGEYNGRPVLLAPYQYLQLEEEN